MPRLSAVGISGLQAGEDVKTVFGLIGRVHRYPDSLGYEAEFKAVVQAWRPELGD